MICTLNKYYSADQIENNGMGGACGTHGGRRVHAGFCWVDLMERNHLEVVRRDVKIILKLILKKWDGDMEWIDQAKDKDRWRVVANKVMILRVL